MDDSEIEELGIEVTKFLKKKAVRKQLDFHANPKQYVIGKETALGKALKDNPDAQKEFMDFIVLAKNDGYDIRDQE